MREAWLWGIISSNRPRVALETLSLQCYLAFTGFRERHVSGTSPPMALGRQRGRLPDRSRLRSSHFCESSHLS